MSSKGIVRADKAGQITIHINVPGTDVVFLSMTNIF